MMHKRDWFAIQTGIGREQEARALVFMLLQRQVQVTVDTSQLAAA